MLKPSVTLRGLLRRRPLPRRAAASSAGSAARLGSPCQASSSAIPRKPKVLPVFAPLQSGSSSPSPTSHSAKLTSPFAAVVSLGERVPELSIVVSTQQLHRVLASRDPHALVGALITLQTRAPHEMQQRLVNDVAAEGETLATLLSACVAVCLGEATENARFLRPPWVRHRVTAARFSPSLALRRKSAGKVSSDSLSASATAPVALAAFKELCRLLQQARRRRSPSGHWNTSSAGGDEGAAATSLHLFSTLCAVCVAPSEDSARALAEWLATRWPARRTADGLSPIGCALAAFSIRAQEGKAVDDGGSHGSGSAEARWLRLWAATVAAAGRSHAGDSTAPSHPLPFLSYLVDAHTATRVCTEWHLHCLLHTQQGAEAVAVLQRVLSPAQEARLPLLSEASLEELLTAFPPHLPSLVSPADAAPKCLPGGVEEEVQAVCPVAAREWQQGLPESTHRALADMLLSRLRAQRPASLRCSPVAGNASAPLLHHRHVPAVTGNAVLFARMVDFLVESLLAVPRAGRRLADLHLLFSVANVDALAASLVPAGQPLTAVMVAATDDERKRKAGLVAQAMGKAIRFLCADGADATRISRDVTEEGWRGEEQEKAEEAALASAVRVLSAFLTLCASREGSLPTRRAEPRWRRELAAKKAVRAHKYQLLLSELPHAELSATLDRLLNRGHLAHGGALGRCLVKEHLVDLRFYSLYLLGSLYQALSTVERGHAVVEGDAFAKSEASLPASSSAACAGGADAAAVLDRLRALYRRREEVFGEQLYVLPVASAEGREGPSGAPSACVGAPAATHAVVSSSDAAPSKSKGPGWLDAPSGVQRWNLNVVPSFLPVRVPSAASMMPSMREAVMRSDVDGGAALDSIRLVKCLMNRTIVAPGGRLVMDSQRRPFDTWVVKGRATVQL